MRRIHSILALLVLLAAGLAAGLNYVNRVVLPVKARQWAQTAASNALGRPVTIERVRVHPWHGFMLENVVVPEDPRFGGQPILQVERISGGILILPLFKQKQLIIPALHIHGPHGRLIQNAEGLWNFQTFTFPKPAARRSSFSVLVPQILLTEGRLEMALARLEPDRHLDFQDVELELRLSLPSSVEGRVSANLQETLPIPLEFRGAYRIPERRLQLQGHSEWLLPVLVSYLPEPARARWGLWAGTLGMDLELSGPVQGPWETKAWLETKDFSWKAADPDPWKAAGEWQLQLEGKIPSPPGPEPWRGLTGTAHLERITLSGIPTVQELREVTGDILLGPEGIRTEKLTGLLPPNIPVEMAGSVALDAARTAGFRVRTAFPLNNPPPLPGDFRKTFDSLKPTGQAELEVIGTGALAPEGALRPTATLMLRNVAATLPQGGSFSDGQGKIRWQPDLLTFSDVTGRLLDRAIRLEGTLVHFDQPEIDARLSWGDLSVETRLNFTSEKIGVEELTGKFPGGTFRVLGEVLRPEPQANLFVESSFRAEEAAPLWPAAQEWVRKNKVAGEIHLRCLLEGLLTRPQELQAELKLSSPRLVYQGIPFQPVSADLRQEKGSVALRSLEAGLADGAISASGLLRRDPPKQPWNGTLALSQLDLQKLGQQLQWKQEVAGRLDLEWQGQGEIADAAAINGAGRVEITGGRIFEFPFLGQFAELIRAPALRAIAFQQARGSFRLSDGRVRTEDLQLISPQATVSIMGSGGFLQGLDSPIQWKIIPTFAPEILPEESRSKIGEVLAKGASYFVGEVQIGGTWKQPQKKFVSKPVTRILNEQIFNVQDLLEEIF